MPSHNMSIKTVTTDWGEMAYVDSDRSRLPLLFLHGTGCDLWDWMSVVEGLTPHLRYIALDFRGHGQSSVPLKPFTVADLADDVLFLTDYLQVQEMLLIGHSLGGMVAMEVARHSLRVAGLVLIEGWTSLSAAGEAFETGRFYGSLSETEIAHIQCKA